MTTSIEPRDRNRDPVALSADRPPYRSSTSGSVSTLRLAFVGPPGSGKGTQAALLAERHGLDHISTGELLRAMANEDSDAGAGIREVMESGELIPDAFVLDLVIERIRRCEAAGQGFILDGFPRTLAQFRILRRGVAEDPVDLVISFRVGREHLDRRLAERGRADDSPATVGRRLESHRRDTEPMIRAMRASIRVVTVDGEGSVESVQRALDGIMRGV